MRYIWLYYSHVNVCYRSRLSFFCQWFIFTVPKVSSCFLQCYNYKNWQLLKWPFNHYVACSGNITDIDRVCKTSQHETATNRRRQWGWWERGRRGEWWSDREPAKPWGLQQRRIHRSGTVSRLRFHLLSINVGALSWNWALHPVWTGSPPSYTMSVCGYIRVSMGQTLEKWYSSIF